MGKRLVVDTNVLISALGWKGLENKLITDIFSGFHSLFISKQILLELEKVMNYPKFKFSTSQKDGYISLLHQFAAISDIPGFLQDVCKDPSDNKFIECAIRKPLSQPAVASFP